MKRLLPVFFILIITGCYQNQVPSNLPPVHINNVFHKLSLTSDTTLTLTLLAPAPKGLAVILLLKGDTVVRQIDIDHQFNTGDIIFINYAFKENTHYALCAVGINLQKEFYDMHAYDFLIDKRNRSVLSRKQNRQHVIKI